MKVQRHQQILEVLEREGSIEVTALSELLNVSDATIRRDLFELSEQGALHRHHGGASIRTASADFVEPPIDVRSSLHLEAKRAIGWEAAALIGEGETVYLSAGTTTYAVARNIVSKRRLTVITPAINIITFLANHPRIEVIVPGGLLAHKHLSLVGHISRCAIQELRADRAVMGVSAIDARQGITSETLLDAESDRMVVGFAPNLVVVADASKFGVIGPALVAPVTAIDHLVTDAGAPPDQVAELQRLGVDVRVATLPTSKGVVTNTTSPRSG